MGLNYLLDTNILSEPTKKIPDVNVLAKLREHNGQFGIASTTWHELNYGVVKMPNGRRKKLLQAYLNTLEKNQLPVLPYDKKSAQWLATERHRLVVSGNTPAKEDSEIAAVAISHELILVTRNVTDFELFSGIIIENWFE